MKKVVKVPKISREELDQQIKDFKKKGGKITKLKKLNIEEERAISKMIQCTMI